MPVSPRVWPCKDCGAELREDPRSTGLAPCATCKGWFANPDAVELAIAGASVKADGSLPTILLPTAFRAALSLERLLGVGGMGCVMRATQTSTNRRVAVKFVFAQVDEGTLHRFRREGRLMAKLRHPAILGVYDVGQVGELPYLILEYVDGPSLKDLLVTEHRLPVDRCMAILGPCLEALAICHDAGIIHRDIKTANVLLTNQGQPKPADFGLSRAIDDESVTKTGCIVGTPRALAPEMI